jgi:hypothetical protein
MNTPSVGSCPWAILHRAPDGSMHLAWYQRAMIVGDFNPAKKPLPNYVTYPDGTSPGPDDTPVCTACQVAPANADLDPVDRATGQYGFLEMYRDQRRPDWRPWRMAPVTDPNTCYVCNFKMKPGDYDGRIKLCSTCADNLARGGE